MDIGTTGLEGAVAADLLMQRDIGLDALYHHLRQGLLHAADCNSAIITPADQFADHRVVERWYHIAVIKVGVDPDAGPTRRVPLIDRSGAGHEIIGIFGIDPALDGVTAYLYVLLAHAQRIVRPPRGSVP